MLKLIRQYMWGGTGEGCTVSKLNSKLRECHSTFASCILALGRAAWPDLDRRPGAETGALAAFHSLLEIESASLRHIRVDTVIVVDHLGRTLPVPTVFCHSWQDFHVVITGFCTSVAGDTLVQRGDYRILTPDDDEVINPSELSTVVRAGMTFEMTIVIHHPRTFDDDEKRTCPRCKHVNWETITASGWLNCERCCGRFHISPADKGYNAFAEGRCPRCKEMNTKFTARGWLDCKRCNDSFHIYPAAGGNKDYVFASESESQESNGEVEMVSLTTQHLEDIPPDESCFFRRISILLKVEPIIATPSIRKASGRRRIHPNQGFCQTCNQVFTTTFALARHAVSHTGQRKFPCTKSGCEWRVSTDSGRLRHERSPTLHKA